jgi:pantoate--beta-alanine ligase
LPRALNDAARDIGNGADVEATLADAKARLLAAGFTQVDYFALVDAATLEPLATLDRTGRLLAAARIGATRLIDNIAL